MNSSLHRERAFVTGVTGFVGANLARLLLDRGRPVRVLARLASDRRNIPEGADVEVFEGDLRDAESMRRAVDGCTEVFHVAADYRFWALDPGELYASNVEGTRNLLEAAKAVGVRRFVHTSTVGTIGLGAAPKPCHEKTPAQIGQFKSHYKASKLRAENLALEYAQRGLPVVVVNPSTPIGPWDRKPTPTGRIIVDFVNGKIPAFLDTGLNFIHVRDVAEGHLLAAEKGRIGERYILGNQNLSMRKFLELIALQVGRKAPRIRIPYRLAWIIGAVSTGYSQWVSHQPPAVALESVEMAKRFMFFDSSKADEELGMTHTPVETAIADALDWFLKNGYFGKSAFLGSFGVENP